MRFDLVSCLWKTARSLFPEDLPVLSDLAAMGYDARWECWEPVVTAPTRDIASGLWPKPVGDRQQNQGDKSGRGAELADAASAWKPQSQGASKNSGDGLASGKNGLTCPDGGTGGARGADSGRGNGTCLAQQVVGRWTMGSWLNEMARRVDRCAGQVPAKGCARMAHAEC